jgi:hypothetical protein
VGRDRFIALVAVILTTMVVAGCSAGPSRTATSSTAGSTSTKPSLTTDVPSNTTDVTPSTVPGLPPEKPAGAAAFTPTLADLIAIGDAYAQFTGFVDCSVEPVPGQLKAAVITATGVKWAFGKMEPTAGCASLYGTLQSPYLAFPFGDITDRGAVFTEPPGGTWTINYFESNPFPCPADLRHPRLSPGLGSPSVPFAVLNAVGVPWSTSPKCGTPLEYIPEAPGGH